MFYLYINLRRSFIIDFGDILKHRLICSCYQVVILIGTVVLPLFLIIYFLVFFIAFLKHFGGQRLVRRNWS